MFEGISFWFAAHCDPKDNSLWRKLRGVLRMVFCSGFSWVELHCLLIICNYKKYFE